MGWSWISKIGVSVEFGRWKIWQMEDLIACFAGVGDPRQENVRHNLHEILMIALCTMLCGGEDCSDMELFGDAKEPFLRQFLRLRQGVPSASSRPRLARTARVSRAAMSDQMQSARKRSCQVRTVCQGPNSFGRKRQGQPAFSRYSQALTISRRSAESGI